MSEQLGRRSPRHSGRPGVRRSGISSIVSLPRHVLVSCKSQSEISSRLSPLCDHMSHQSRSQSSAIYWYRYGRTPVSYNLHVDLVQVRKFRPIPNRKDNHSNELIHTALTLHERKIRMCISFMKAQYS